MKRVAISVGDLNGVGAEILLSSHFKISKMCKPIYCTNKNMLKKAAILLNKKIPKDMEFCEIAGDFEINPKNVDAKSGLYSFMSFLRAIKLSESKSVDALVTLPISKEAWALANIAYRGHTEFLRDYFKKDAIMVLGCEKLYVALYTEHIPLKTVFERIKAEQIEEFLLNLQKDFSNEQIAVLALNPHAGENGLLGDEEHEINMAIERANKKLGKETFFGAYPPDTAFTPKMRERYRVFVAMYHDVGLAPLKTLYFEESINISLGLPILRSSVDHGTAFDIAYENKKPDTKSYINAIKYVIS